MKLVCIQYSKLVESPINYDDKPGNNSGGYIYWCNKQNFVSDYNPTNNIIAFGAANIVALWNPLSKSHNGVYHTLKKHESEVTGVKFIPNSPYLVSIGKIIL